MEHGVRGRLERSRFVGSIALLALLFSACRDSGSEADPASSQAPNTEEAPPERIVVPYDGRLRLVTLAIELDGLVTPLEVGEVVEIPQGASIHLETWQRLDDHRVRLVDESNKLIPFTLESGPVALRDESSSEPEPGGTWFRLQPASPLLEGETYSLRLEPELEEQITDHEGRPYEDLVLPLRVLLVSEAEGEDETGSVQAEP